jgi:hypothetical protein
MNANTRTPLSIKLLVLVIGLLIAIPVSVILYRIATWEGIFPEVEPKPFDAVQWKAWTIKDMQQSEDIRRAFGRLDMLDDLIASHNLTGMTVEQLKELLGEPNPEFLPLESDWGKWDVAYLVGPDFVDYEVLVFRLDGKGRVASFKVVDL